MSARISLCGTYRYTLERKIVNRRNNNRVLFIMLNPSTADASKNDPTVTRCVNFADSWGFGHLTVCNIYAYRSTNPDVLKHVPDAVGPDNDRTLREEIANANLVVCAWGTHASAKRQKEVLTMIPDPHCLGLTSQGYPRHPLYIRKTTRPQRLIVVDGKGARPQPAVC